MIHSPDLPAVAGFTENMKAIRLSVNSEHAGSRGVVDPGCPTFDDSACPQSRFRERNFRSKLTLLYA
jgi:hypothetical protein